MSEGARWRGGKGADEGSTTDLQRVGVALALGDLGRSGLGERGARLGRRVECGVCQVDVGKCVRLVGTVELVGGGHDSFEVALAEVDMAKRASAAPGGHQQEVGPVGPDRRVMAASSENVVKRLQSAEVDADSGAGAWQAAGRRHHFQSRGHGVANASHESCQRLNDGGVSSRLPRKGQGKHEGGVGGHRAPGDACGRKRHRPAQQESNGGGRERSAGRGRVLVEFCHDQGRHRHGLEAHRTIGLHRDSMDFCGGEGGRRGGRGL